MAGLKAVDVISDNIWFIANIYNLFWIYMKELGHKEPHVGFHAQKFSVIFLTP